MTTKEYPIIVYCPECRKRVFDKLTPTQGIIEIKCPHCRNVVSINLSYRINPNVIKYRISNNA